MTYRVGGLGEPATFDSGASLLITGESALTKQRLFDAVAPEANERTVVITADSGAETVVDELESRGASRDQLGVIDCTSTESDVEGVPVRQLNSPGDLTGLSLEFAKLLDDDPDRVRVGFSSISTVLMYAELRTMFRFLHVFTARIRSGGMLGVFSMDPGMHEEQAVNTIRAVFDAEARIGDDSADLRGMRFAQ